MRRKVESIKPFGSKISFKVLIKKIICFMEASLFLATYGCAPRKANATPVPADDQKSVTQVMSDGSGPIDNIESSAVATPETTPIDASFITPEASATPIINSYFLFSPTMEEEKKLETAAEEYLKRLEGNKSNGLTFSSSNLMMPTIVNNLCGNFYNILDTGAATSKEDCLFNLHNFLSLYIVTVGTGMNEIFNNKSDGVYFNNPESYKIFETGGFENFPGVDTLSLVENVIENINDSIKKKDNISLTKNAIVLATIAEMIFINNGGSYDDVKITAFKNMYPTIKLFIREEILNEIWYIGASLQDLTIKANASSIYNLYQLAEIIGDDEIADLIDKEIFALMDAYIEAVKSGKIVIDEENNGEETKLELAAPTSIPGN